MMNELEKKTESEEKNCPHNNRRDVDKLYGTGKVTFRCEDCSGLVYMKEEEFNDD